MVVRVGGTVSAGTIITAPHRPERLSFIDSKLVEGTNGLAGELGHLPIGRRFIEDLNEMSESEDLVDIDYDGWECNCGRPHHLNAFASGTAVVRRLEASGYEVPDEPEGMANLIEEIGGEHPDEDIVQALSDVGRILSRALTGPILMLDPYRITITGSLANEHLVEGMRRERDKWANTIDDRVQIGFLDSDDASYSRVRGAGLAVIRRLVYRNFLDKRARDVESFDFSNSDLRALRSRRPRWR
jgi:predicted NBD/HSP70 family sugar kinase